MNIIPKVCVEQCNGLRYSTMESCSV